MNTGKRRVLFSPNKWVSEGEGSNSRAKQRNWKRLSSKDGDFFKAHEVLRESLKRKQANRVKLKQYILNEK